MSDLGIGGIAAAIRAKGDPLEVSPSGHYRLNPDGSVQQDVAQENPAIDNMIRNNYGFEAWLLDIPEIKNIIYHAVAEGWDPGRIQGALTETNWWKTHDANQRKWLELAGSDSATAQDAVNKKVGEIQRLADKMGVQVDPGRMAAMAQDSLQNAWTGEQLQQALGHEFTMQQSGGRPAAMKGLAAEAAQRFRQLAGDYLVRVDDSVIQPYIQESLSTGKIDEAGFQQYLQQQAAQLYPWMTQSMKDNPNLTPEAFTQPYRQHIAHSLEIAPDSIDFMDPKWQKLLYSVDPKTSQATANPLYSVEQQIRTDPSYGWRFTNNANDAAGRLEMTIGRAFGQTA